MLVFLSHLSSLRMSWKGNLPYIYLFSKMNRESNNEVVELRKITATLYFIIFIYAMDYVPASS